MNVTSRCFGPSAPLVMNGILISVCIAVESSILAFSAASSRRWRARAILLEVYAVLFHECVRQPIDDLCINVASAEVAVAVGRFDLYGIRADFEHGDVECSAAEVEHRYLLILFLVEAVGQCGRRRLIDDALYIESGDLPGVFRRLALGVVEVSRNGDDRLGYLLAQARLGVSS